MKFFACFLLFALLASCQALKCWDCDNCREDSNGDPKTCDADQDICMKIIAGSHIARKCEKFDLCSLGKVERAANRAWDAIANVFSEVDRDTPLVYCCDGDYCNSSNRGLPSIVLTLLPLMVVAFFKA